LWKKPGFSPPGVRPSEAAHPSAASTRNRGRARGSDRVAIEVAIESSPRKHLNNYGQIMEQLWTKYGNIMDKIWKHYGKNMEKLWNEYGKNMENIWKKYGTIMEKLWTKLWNNNGKLWTHYGNYGNKLRILLLKIVGLKPTQMSSFFFFFMGIYESNWIYWENIQPGPWGLHPLRKTLL